jgi:2-polyprenyl-3-methyl-5-hydroxy-6-metoxy-1,4-benzoquinol methylase
MASITDERGYNQGFKETKALIVRTERRLDQIVSEFDHRKKNGSVLEIGCGTGLLSKMLSDKTPFTVTGMDISKDFINHANQKHANEKTKFIQMDLNHIEKELGTFDYVVGNGILHHLYFNLDHFLIQMKKCLKPGGKLIFWEPNLYNPYVFLVFKFKFFRKIAKLEPSEMAFTGRFIRKALKKAEFKNINVIYRDFLLPNTPDSLINVAITVGKVMESNPATSRIAQSIFLTAEN